MFVVWMSVVIWWRRVGHRCIVWMCWDGVEFSSVLLCTVGLRGVVIWFVLGGWKCVLCFPAV